LRKSITRLPSITDILKKISDDKALILFNKIAISGESYYIPLKEMNLTTKQYYSRISGLINAGLIRRSHGKYYLTPLGNIVNEAHMIIGKALNYYWKIKAIESIQNSSEGISKQDLSKLVDTLIDNYEIKDILLKALNAYNCVQVDDKVQNESGLSLRKAITTNNIKQKNKIDLFAD
jgi:hypothetical protein